MIVANLFDTTVLNSFKVRTTQVTNGEFKVDEIRMGTTWEEVTPHEILPLPGTLIMIQ